MNETEKQKLSLHPDCAHHPPGYDLHLAAAAGLMHVYEGLSGSFASMATSSDLGQPAPVSIASLISHRHHMDSVNSTAPPPDVGNDILAQLRGSVKSRINSCWSVEAVKQGVVHAKGGNHEEAASCYAKALELDPSNSDAFVARGALQANRKYLKEAAADFERALALKPENVNAGKYLDAVRSKQQQQQEEEDEQHGQQQQQQQQQEDQEQPQRQQQRPSLKPSPPHKHHTSTYTSQHSHHHRPSHIDKRSDSQEEEEEEEELRHAQPEQQRSHESGKHRHFSMDDERLHDKHASGMGRHNSDDAQRQPSHPKATHSRRDFELSEKQQDQHHQDRVPSPPTEVMNDGDRFRAKNGSERELRGARDSPIRHPHHSRSRSREEGERLAGKDKKRRHKDRDGSSRGKDKKEKTKSKQHRSSS